MRAKKTLGWWQLVRPLAIRIPQTNYRYIFRCLLRSLEFKIRNQSKKHTDMALTSDAENLQKLIRVLRDRLCLVASKKSDCSSLVLSFRFRGRCRLQLFNLLAVLAKNRQERFMDQCGAESSWLKGEKEGGEGTRIAISAKGSSRAVLPAECG